MNRIIQVAEERGEFIYLEDGYLYYAPDGIGAISAQQLRILADELDRRNKNWDDQINEYFRTGPRSETSSRVDGGQTYREDGFGISTTPINGSSDP